MADLLRNSERESEILGLKVARGRKVIEKLETNDLWNEILSKRYDICRIKINLTDAILFDQLDLIPCPSRVFTLNYHNVKIVSENPAPMPDEISWELYSENFQNQLLHCLEIIYESRSWPAFTQGEFSKLVSPEAEKKLFIEFFSRFHPAENPDSRTFFLKWKNEIAGVFMGTISGDVFLGSLYGILPDFRGKGFSKRIYDAMDWICLELGLKFFKNEIHLLNLLSQKSAQSSSLVPTEIQANITFYPLLSNKSQELLLLDFILESESVFIQSVLYEVKTKFPQFHLKSIKAGYSKVISAPENVKFNINFPVQTESFLLAVCTIANRDLTGQPIFYFEFSS